MAKMPRGSSLIYNPSSAAPGFIIKNDWSKHLESILLGSGIGIRVPFPILGVLRFDFGLGIIDNKIKSNSFHFGIGQKF